MRGFPDPDAVDSFESAKALFRGALYDFAARKALPEFTNFCRSTFATTANGFVRPYAFAYAARSLLHHRASYLPNPRGGLTLGQPALDQIDSLLKAPGAINDRDNYFHDIVAGIRDYVTGNMDEACLNFARAARFHDFFRVVRDDFGGGASFGRSFPTDLERATARPALDPSDWQEGPLPGGAWRLAVSSHADSLYAEAFFPDWIRQLGGLAVDGLLLHLHVIFRRQRDADLLGRLEALALECRLPLFLTSEAGQPRDKAYFAASRFLRADEILRRFSCNTVFVDADAYLVRPSEFAARDIPRLTHEDAVTGMIAPLFAEGYLPWRRFSAGWLVIPASPLGLRFAGHLRDSLNYFWDPRFGRNWWIDQFCLEIARLLTLRDPPTKTPFRSWPAVYPDAIAAVGERNKNARVAETATVRAMMSRGLTFHQAMMRINRGEDADA